MILEEARLKTYQVTREGHATESTSGLSAPAVPITFDVLMDVQQSSTPRFVVQAGEERFSGAYRGYTYDDRLQVGDRLYSTPYGALRVEGVYPWDDEDVVHYEVGMVPA